MHQLENSPVVVGSAVAVVPYNLPSTMITPAGEYPSVRSLKLYKTVTVDAAPYAAKPKRTAKTAMVIEQDFHCMVVISLRKHSQDTAHVRGV